MLMNKPLTMTQVFTLTQVFMTIAVLSEILWLEFNAECLVRPIFWRSLFGRLAPDVLIPVLNPVGTLHGTTRALFWSAMWVSWILLPQSPESLSGLLME